MRLALEEKTTSGVQMFKILMVCCGCTALMLAIFHRELWEALMWWFLTWIAIDCIEED